MFKQLIYFSPVQHKASSLDESSFSTLREILFNFEFLGGLTIARVMTHNYCQFRDSAAKLFLTQLTCETI